MRPAKSVQDCSESSVLARNRPHCQRKVGLDHSVLCFAGLQPEAAKRIVTAAQREELGMNWVAEATKEYKRAIWEAAQSASSPDKWLPREEVAERRGASARRGSSVKK